MKYTSIRNNLNIIKKLVFILILFALSLIFMPKVDAYTVTYPDNKVDTVEEGEKYILSMKDHKEPENISTVTFKSHQDGVDDYVYHVKKKYFLEKWIIDGVEYEPGSPIEVNSDITVTGSYQEYIEPVTIPSAPLVYGYTFIGWYDQEEGGTRYKTYSGTQDLTLHAQYIVENRAPFIVEVNNSKWTKFKSTATAFRKATVEEYNAKQAELTSSDNYGNEYHPIYIWLEGTELVYYTESSSITITSPNKMFNNWSKIEYIDLSGWYIRYLYSSNSQISATDISYMFNNCSSLTYLDISDFDTSKVTDMSYMFSGTKLASLDLSHFNTSKVTEMMGMFSSMGSLEYLNISSFDTSKVTNMGYLFSNSNINYLDLSNFNTSNVTNMNSMFYNSKNTNYLNISSFDTSKVTYMSSMFSGSSFKHLDLSNLDVSQLKSFDSMFFNAQSLEYVDLSNWDTRRSTSFYRMFKNCYNLKYLDLSSFKIYKATNLSQMFQGCRNLEELDLSSFDLNNVEYISYMFAEMSKIKTIDISNFSTPNLKNMQCLFCDDTSLETIYANELFNTDQCPTGVMSDGTMVYVFVRNDNLVGQAGTRFSEVSGTGKEYAVIDDPDNGKPGYFTYKAYNPKIYYPDMSYEEVEPYYVLTLPESYSKADDNLAKVTLKYEDGKTEDKEVYVKKNYTFNNWLVYDEVAEPGDTFVITFDTYLEADYVESIVGADLQAPRRLDYKFLGWYTDPENGELVESYNGEEDITLYAHWTEAITSTLITGWDLNVLMANNDYNTFRKATEAEYNNVSSTLTDANIISTDDSDVPTYYWIENGDFVYYSEADIIYLNQYCANLFLNTKFRSIDLSGLDSYKITDARCMFSVNPNLTNINLTNFDAKNIKQAGSMFNDLDSIKDLDLSSFDTSGIENFGGMFSGLDSIEELDISSFEIKNATIMMHMFSDMYNLEVVYVSDKWDVSSYIGQSNFSELFYFVPNLTGYYGTEFNAQLISPEYAKADEIGSPGYFTDVSHKGETHSVTYPDGTVEMVRHNKRIELEENTTTSDLVEDLATITFKFHNGEDDIIKHVQNVYYADGFSVNGISYSNGDDVRINEDKVIDYNYTGYPTSPEFPENPTDDRRLFLGWYTEEEDGDEVDYYDGEDDITLHAHWSEELLKLTVDGKTTLVEPGYVYTIPNGIPTENSDYITIYLDDNYNGEYKEVKISYGTAINYQRINGTRYYPGDTYVVNEDTTVTSNKSRNKTAVMDPYVEEPTYHDENGDYVFKGWIMAYWDYVDPIDINIDIYSLTPEDVNYDGQTFLADFGLIDEEEQARVTIIDDYRKANYTYIVQKGLEIPIENISSDMQNSRNTYICNNVNDDCIDYNYEINAIVDHYLINGTNYPNGEGSYVVNEDTTIEVVRVLSENEYCGDNESCPDIIYTEPYTRVTFSGEDYIYTGMYFDYDGEGNILTLDNFKPSGDANGSYNNTVYMNFADGTENVIVSIDDDYRDRYIVPKGIGTVPDGRDDYIDEYDITFKYEDGETPDLVEIISMGSKFDGYRESWNTYDPGDEYDYQNDVNFRSQYENEEHIPDLPTVDDDHFKGWYDTPEYLDNIYPLYDMYSAYYNYEDYGTDTYYAHWGEPTVEICHGKGDCEEIVKGTAVVLERPEPTVITAHFTLDYNTEEPGYEPKQVTTTRTDTVEYFMINNERYDFGETYVFNENCDMYGVTTSVYTSDFEGYYNDNWDYGLNINGYELRGWCATTDGRYCRYYDEDEDIVQPDGLTLYASYWQSEGDTVRVTVDWDTTYDWPKGESEVLPDEVYDTINFDVPEDYYRDITFDLNDGTGNYETGRILVHNVFIGYRVGNDDSRRYQRHDLYTFYKDIHIQSQYEDELRDIEFPDVDLEGFKGWYTSPEGGRKITNTEDFVKYVDLYNEFTLYAQYYEGLPTDLELDTDEISLSIGGTHVIGVTFIPEGSGDTLTYTAYDDTKISVVDGLVTALAPGETTITVGTENTDIEKTITVTVMEDKLKTDIYDVREADLDNNKDRIIIGAEPETTIGEFKDNLLNPNEYVKIYDIEGNELDDDAIVMTGQVIKLEYNGIVVDEAILVLRGDVNGDGIINVSDYLKVLNHSSEKEELQTYIEFAAADVAEDEILNVSDYLKIKNYAAEKLDTLNE